MPDATSMSATPPTSDDVTLPPFASPFGLPLASVLSEHPLRSFRHWSHDCLLPLPTVHCFPEAAHRSHLFCTGLGRGTSTKSITHEPVQRPLTSRPSLSEPYELRLATSPRTACCRPPTFGSLSLHEGRFPARYEPPTLCLVRLQSLQASGWCPIQYARFECQCRRLALLARSQALRTALALHGRRAQVSEGDPSRAALRYSRQSAPATTSGRALMIGQDLRRPLVPAHATCGKAEHSPQLASPLE